MALLSPDITIRDNFGSGDDVVIQNLLPAPGQKQPGIRVMALQFQSQTQLQGKTGPDSIPYLVALHEPARTLLNLVFVFLSSGADDL